MISLTEIQRQIWENNYKAPEDTCIEDSFKRVSRAASEVQTDPEMRQILYNEVYRLMSEFKFIPGGRILANAGVKDRAKATLYNCYVYHPYDFGIRDIDSMQGIFTALSKSAKILSSQGGIGVNFTFIRPNGYFISGTGARTPGVLQFMQLWDKASTIITMGSDKPLLSNDPDRSKVKKKIRKGAQMGILDISHAQIKQFISIKQKSNKLTKFNLSILVPDRFMNAVQNDDIWKLGFPDINYQNYKQQWDGDLQKWIVSGKPFIVSQQIRARQLWDMITISTYNRNQPGILFYDTFNKYNPLSYCETIITTNPCISGDTKILIPHRKKAVTVRQLAQRDRGFKVYSIGIRPSDGKPQCIISYAKAAKTKVNVDVVRVTSRKDPSISFKCTPDHLIAIGANESQILYQQAQNINQIVTDGSYKIDPQHLKHNKVNAANYIVQPAGKQDVYDISVSNYHGYQNFAVVLQQYDDTRNPIKMFVHNCAQIGMSSGVCNLGNLNLPRFYNDGKFDFNQFQLAIKMAVCFLDNINQISYVPVEQYKALIKQKRRIGLGITGLGSLLMMMGLKFGSYSAIKMVQQIFKFKTEIQLLTSAMLGKQKGSFQNFDKDKYFNTTWWQELQISYKIKRLIEQMGTMRNGTNSDCAPAGQSSVLLGNVSNGIQPVFMKQYNRWMIVVDEAIWELKQKGYDIPDAKNGQWFETQVFKFATRGDQQILRGTIDNINYQIDKNRGLVKQVAIRDYGYQYLLDHNISLDGVVETPDLSVLDHLNMLQASAKYVNQNQSKTINIPNDYTFQQFKDVYMTVWKKKIKGATTYRAGTMTAVLQQKGQAEKYLTDLQKLYKQMNGNVILQDVKIPEKSYALQYKIKDKNKKKWYFTLSFVDKTLLKPFAIFIRTNNRQSNQVTDIVIHSIQQLLMSYGIRSELIQAQRQKYIGQSNVDKIGRAIGMALRHNIPITKIVETLDKHNDGLSTLLFHIRKILSEYIPDGTQINDKLCQDCGLDTLVYQSGCVSCTNCGNSKCS